jgi:hypothetical protein
MTLQEVFGSDPSELGRALAQVPTPCNECCRFAVPPDECHAHGRCLGELARYEVNGLVGTSEHERDHLWTLGDAQNDGHFRHTARQTTAKPCTGIDHASMQLSERETERN